MSKEKGVATRSTAMSWLAELVHVGRYKRSQGRIARQATFGALAAGIALAVWRLAVYLSTASITAATESVLSTWPLSYLPASAQDWVARAVEIASLQYSLPLVLIVAGLWVSYRLVNIPRFADFLIAVEAEMNKVSWPSKDELVRSAIVVIFVIFVMSMLLFGYDALWMFVFETMGVLQKAN